MVYESKSNIEDEGPKTSFNSSLDIIQRISHLEYSLISCLIDKDLRGAFNLLVMIETEIDFKLKPDEREKLKNMEEEIEADIDEAENKFVSEGKIFFRNYPLRKAVEKKLLELKRTLGRYKYKVGLGMTDQVNPSKAIIS